eukprot:scaffold2088_cov399-Prasinococcus_capsulatus_cf.AAC.10
MPDTQVEEIEPFVKSLRGCPKSGLHNPFKNPHRYLMYGDVSARAAEEMSKPHVQDFFAKCIQRVVPKSYAQAMELLRVGRLDDQRYSAIINICKADPCAAVFCLSVGPETKFGFWHEASPFPVTIGDRCPVAIAGRTARLLW